MIGFGIFRLFAGFVLSLLRVGRGLPRVEWVLRNLAADHADNADVSKVGSSGT